MRLNSLMRSAGVVTMFVAGTFLLFGACEDTEEPPFPDDISIIGGDNQYSKIGTQLEEPLSVVVRLPDNTGAGGFPVEFRVLSGDVTLSNQTDNTDDAGLASTRVTLGMTEEQVRIRALLSADEAQYVDFTATAGRFFCPEEDPTFQPKFPPPPRGQAAIFLLTRRSSHHKTGGDINSGIVSIRPTFTPTASIDTQSLRDVRRGRL